MAVNLTFQTCISLFEGFHNFCWLSVHDVFVSLNFFFGIFAYFSKIRSKLYGRNYVLTYSIQMFHRFYKYAKASNCIIKITNIIRLRDRRDRIINSAKSNLLSVMYSHRQKAEIVKLLIVHKLWSELFLRTEKITWSKMHWNSLAFHGHFMGICYGNIWKIYLRKLFALKFRPYHNFCDNSML